MHDPLFPPRPTALAHEILRPLIQPGDLVIDATAGNGHDTLFLAECVGATGKVLAFDVQEKAISAARERVAEFAGQVKFFLESHTAMTTRAASGSVSVIMFNLGYLPGEDHDLTTDGEETLRALDAAAGLLKSGGVISTICYPGHPAGATEAAAVERWMTARAADRWRVAKYSAVGTRRPAPFLMIAGNVSPARQVTSSSAALLR